MRNRIRISLSVLAIFGLLGPVHAAPKRDRTVDINYPPGALGHGVKIKISGVEAQIQKKTAFVWLSRGSSRVMRNSGARLTFESRNWNNVRVRLRPKRDGYVTLKRTAFLSGPADVEFGLPEQVKKEKALRFTVPASYEVEAFNVLYRTLLDMGDRADLVVRFRDQLKPKGDTSLETDKKRYTVDFGELRPNVVGYLAAMAVLTREGLVRDGLSVPVPSRLQESITKPSKDPAQLGLIYMFGRSVSAPLPDSHRPKSASDGHTIPLNVAGLLRDLSDKGREAGGGDDYDAIYVPNLRGALSNAFRDAAGKVTSTVLPIGGVVITPVPGTGKPVKNWIDLLSRLAPEASQPDVRAVLRLNGFSSAELVW